MGYFLKLSVRHRHTEICFSKLSRRGYTTVGSGIANSKTNENSMFCCFVLPDPTIVGIFLLKKNTKIRQEAPLQN